MSWISRNRQYTRIFQFSFVNIVVICCLCTVTCFLNKINIELHCSLFNFLFYIRSQVTVHRRFTSRNRNLTKSHRPAENHKNAPTRIYGFVRKKKEINTCFPTAMAKIGRMEKYGLLNLVQYLTLVI